MRLHHNQAIMLEGELVQKIIPWGSLFMKKILALLVLITSANSLTACVLKHSFTLHQIINHLGHYRLVHSKFHTGDLLQHSLWTARSLAQWFDEDKFWVEKLEPIRDLVILGGLMHDIGKAGDYNFYYICKRNHPMVGYHYILNQQPFFLRSSETIQFSKLYDELSIALEEQRMLGVMIAMHLELGNAMKIVAKGGLEALDNACHQYLAKLQNTCKIMNFNNGTPTLTLLHAALAVSAADVRAIHPNSYVNDSLKQTLGEKLAYGHTTSIHPGINAYKKFDLDGRGRLVRQRLCKLFEKQMQH